MPKVFIIILNWNGWKDTIECLESVFRNSYPNYQVVVVDNDSTDGSVEKIKEWTDGKGEMLTPELCSAGHRLSRPSVKKTIPYIFYNREEAEGGGNLKLENEIFVNPHMTGSHSLILIQSGENLGFSGGNNVGMKFALNRGNCDYVLLLNNDTAVKNDFLVKLISFMENSSSVGVAGPKINNEKGKVNRSCTRRRLEVFDCIFAIGIGRVLFPIKRWINKHHYMNEYDFDYPKKIDVISGSCMLFKAEVLRVIGLLDENIFLYYENK